VSSETVSETESSKAPTALPASVLSKRLRKFRSLKRGYYSFLILVIAYVMSFALPVLMSSRALIVSYEGKLHFPMFSHYQGKTFGQMSELTMFGEAPANYRLLAERSRLDGKGNWVLMPLIRPYDPFESARIFLEREIVAKYQKGDFSADKPAPKKDDDDDGYSGDDDDDEYSGDDDGDEDGEDVDDNEEARNKLLSFVPPYAPSREQWFGSDDRGRDLLVRLAYGFRVSITFALVLLVFSYTVGISLGAILGFYGGWFDLIGQRFIEVWQTIPFLFTVMILGAAIGDSLPYRPELWTIVQPRFLMLTIILAAFSWMGMTYYVRGEVLREKARDYVGAAISIGTPDSVIIFKHLLPNSLTPVVTFAPFAIVGYVSSLVALDYLGFGLPAPMPSWGELMKQALPEHIKSWWLVAAPIGALFTTLLLVVFIGEAVREAFDPKVFSRLR